MRRTTIRDVANHLIKVLTFPKTTRQYEINRPREWRPYYIYGYHPENSSFRSGRDWTPFDGSPDFMVYCGYNDWESTTRFLIEIHSPRVNIEPNFLVDRLERSITGGPVRRFLNNL